MNKDKKQLIKEGVLNPLEDPNTIPPYLKFIGKKYKFSANKGNLLVYTYTPKFYDDSTGSSIIVEHRKNKRWADRFYVMFMISGANGYSYGYTYTHNLKGISRQAVPSFNEYENL